MTSILATVPTAGDEPDDTWTGDVTEAANGTSTGYAFLVQASPQAALANATWTPMVFDGEVFDEESAHSTSVNTTRYTAVYDGLYEVSGVVCWAANATGGRGAAVAKNGTRVQGSTTYGAANPTAATPTVTPTARVPVQMQTGDYLEIMGIQNSGGSLATQVQSDNASSMTVKRVVRL